MKKTGAYIIIGIILVIVIGAFFVFSPKQENIVKISDRSLPSALPVYVAIEKGYFENYGLKPELVKLTTSNQAFDALINGDLDVGEIAIDPYIYAEANTNSGVKISLVGKWDENQNKNFDSLFVKQDSSINSIIQLEGKKIGVFPGVTAKTFLKYYLETQEIDTSNIEFIELSPSLQISSLESGSVDALYAYQTIMTVAENQHFKKVDESLFNKLDITYYAIYGFSPKIDDEVSKNSLLALSDALEFMKEHEEESREILSKYTSLGDLSFQMSYFPEYTLPNEEDITNINSLVNFYYENNLIENKFMVEKDSFYSLGE